jgi:hypothetical protein
MMVNFVVWSSVIYLKHLIEFGTKASYLNYIHMESEAMFLTDLQIIFLVVVKKLCLKTNCLQMQV